MSAGTTDGPPRGGGERYEGSRPAGKTSLTRPGQQGSSKPPELLVEIRNSKTWRTSGNGKANPSL